MSTDRGGSVVIIRNIQSFIALGMATLCLLSAGDLAAQAVDKRSFPRIMGMNIGAKNYDDPKYLDALSRPDVLILGFHALGHPGWRGREKQQAGGAPGGEGINADVGYLP